MLVGTCSTFIFLNFHICGHNVQFGYIHCKQVESLACTNAHVTHFLPSTPLSPILDPLREKWARTLTSERPYEIEPDLHTCTCTSMHICTYTCTYTCTHTRTYTCTPVRIPAPQYAVQLYFTHIKSPRV